MAMCDRTLADRRPDTARNRLQADAMLVRGASRLLANSAVRRTFTV
jgi:hypothetical protein